MDLSHTTWSKSRCLITIILICQSVLGGIGVFFISPQYPCIVLFLINPVILFIYNLFIILLIYLLFYWLVIYNILLCLEGSSDIYAFGVKVREIRQDTSVFMPDYEADLALGSCSTLIVLKILGRDLAGLSSRGRSLFELGLIELSFCFSFPLGLGFSFFNKKQDRFSLGR